MPELFPLYARGISLYARTYIGVALNQSGLFIPVLLAE